MNRRDDMAMTTSKKCQSPGDVRTHTYKPKRCCKRYEDLNFIKIRL